MFTYACIIVFFYDAASGEIICGNCCLKYTETTLWDGIRGCDRRTLYRNDFSEASHQQSYRTFYRQRQSNEVYKRLYE